MIARHLAEAEAMGYASHGAYRLPSYMDQKERRIIDPCAQPKCVQASVPFFRVDGGRGLGIPAMEYAVDLALENARSQGAVIVGVVNCGHTGRVGAYVERAAREGFVAVCFGGGGREQWPNVAPYGAAQGVVSTNPIAAGFPASRIGPIYCDFATSSIATGKAAVATLEGSSLPVGIGLDRSGEVTSAPAAVLGGGCLLPAAGPKGSGLAIICELMTGALLGPAREFNWILIVFRSDGFLPLDDVRAGADRLADDVHRARPLPEFEEVLMPGEFERRRLERARRDGLTIGFGVSKKLLAAAKSLGIVAEDYFQLTSSEPAQGNGQIAK